MISLIKIEFYKILPNRTFWALVSIYVILLTIFFYGGSKIESDALTLFNLMPEYYFPRIWHYITFLASWFNWLLGIIIIMLVTHEFSYKTIRYQIAFGLSKSDFILGKIGLISVFCILTTLYLIILGLIFGFIYSKDTSFSVIIDETNHLITYFIQAFSYMSLALLIGVIFKRSLISVVLFLSYVAFIERIFSAFIPDNIDMYFPMNVITSLTPIPLQIIRNLAAGVEMPITTESFIAIGYSLLFCLISYYLIKRSDL